MQNRKHILEALQHFIVGFFLAAEGYAKLEHEPLIGWIILSLGVILLVYFVYDLAAKRESFKLKVLSHLFEAVALAFTTYIFFKEGTVYIKWVNLLACVATFASVIVQWRKHRAPAEQQT